MFTTSICRLEEVMYDNKRLFLVFEYLELDLKKYMDTTPALSQNRHLIKVDKLLPLYAQICNNTQRINCKLP